MGLIASAGKIQSVRHHVRREGLSLFGEPLSDKEFLSLWDNIEVNHEKMWGTKIEPYDLPIVERYLSINHIPITSAKWVWLRRHNKIRQSISYCKTIRGTMSHVYDSDTDRVERMKEARDDTEIPVEDINQSALMLFFMDSIWERFFGVNGIEPYTLFYEDFIDESGWKDMASGVLDFLGVPYTLPLRPTTRQIRTSDDAACPNYKRVLDLNDSIFREYSYDKPFWGKERSS